MPKTIDVQEAQIRPRELLSQESQGEEFVLTKDNKPVARVIPISSRVAGLHTGAIWTSDDFDEPLMMSHVFALGNLFSHHKDPFNRLLIAQSLVEDAVLVTGDRMFSEYPITLAW